MMNIIHILMRTCRKLVTIATCAGGVGNVSGGQLSNRDMTHATNRTVVLMVHLQFSEAFSSTVEELCTISGIYHLPHKG